MKRSPEIFAFFLLLFSRGLLFAQANVIYTYPVADSRNISVRSAIGIRFSENISRSSLTADAFEVTGASSGRHSGSVKLALDGKTVIFTPEKNFSAGEKVEVAAHSLRTVSGSATLPYFSSFTVARSAILPSSFYDKQPDIPPFLPVIKTPVPEFASDNAPQFTVIKSDNPAPGQIYMAAIKTLAASGEAYMLIVGNDGNLLWHKKVDTLYATDFRAQGNGLYTYWDALTQVYYSMDTKYYVVLDQYAAVNGYQVNDHDFRLLPTGGYVLLADDFEQVDMSKIADGGDPNAIVKHAIIQEFDAAKNLVFEWHSQDSGNYQITDATHELLSGTYVDYAHMNSIELDGDTAFIVSARNMDEITKIDRRTGKIIWRWGGINNQFTFTGDSVQFSHQHAVYRTSSGTILMFDNGNYRPEPQRSFSRAVEYRLDEKQKTAAKVWEFRHNPDFDPQGGGNAQRLSNGNTFIGWGGYLTTALTEVRPDGSTALEIAMHEPNGTNDYYSYRALKYTENEVEPKQNGIAAAVSLTELRQNYPNPARGEVSISFTLAAPGEVKLVVYDALGRETKILYNGFLDEGEFRFIFNGTGLPGGTYFYTLVTGSGQITKTLVLVK